MPQMIARLDSKTYERILEKVNGSLRENEAKKAK